jgi:hypothetical protein
MKSCAFSPLHVAPHFASSESVNPATAGIRDDKKEEKATDDDAE